MPDLLSVNPPSVFSEIFVMAKESVKEAITGIPEERLERVAMDHSLL